jgi:hypothetical protein
MASIHREIVVEVGVDAAWTALRALGAADRLFAPVLVDAELNGDMRTVRFANGMVVHEQILDVDDTRRRCRCWTLARSAAGSSGSPIFSRSRLAATSSL